MKRVFMLLMCLFAMMAASQSAKAQEITINLYPGWTWISYTNAEAMDIPTALGDFVPMDGDKIMSQYSFAYYNNGQWRGRLQQFTPGLGYIYYSMRGEPVSFVFANSTPQSQVTVTTSEPMLITAVSALGGGEVTVNDGTYILVKGLCWATHENPTTNEDFYQEAGSGVGSFSASMTGLNISTTYYVRAYAVTANGTVYGNQKTFTTRDGIPTVTTDTVTSITGATASSGGTVTDDGGLNVTARGVCWSIFPSPTLADAHTSDGNGTGSFSSYITGLSMSTTYYVRAYATNSFVTVYGNQLSFTTTNDEYVYVDLGLPSGLLWATCNVGADTPEAYGDYFAWGETQPKGTYNWSTYQYCNGSINTLTKYCNNSGYGYNGFTDNLTTLLPEDDAATANWGSDWRMPTEAEWQELLDNTTCTWTTQNGVDGRLFTASNGNSLFLPAAGSRYGSSLYYAGSYGGYWSSSLNTDSPDDAWGFYFYSGSYLMGYNTRYYGQSVRAVRSVNNEHAYVDLGLPSGLLWATSNVGANLPEDYGDYFAWGETQPKVNYNWSTYQYCNGSYNTLTKYCTDASYGYNGFTDNLTTLLPEDDAATANWGGDWRMPTKEEWQELYNNTNVIWTTQNGVNGRLFISSNGNSLFLPASGYFWGSELYNAGSNCLYGSSSFRTDFPINAWYFSFDSGNYQMDGSYTRSGGFTVRPVRSSEQNTVPTGAINGKFTINADGDQVYFSQGNLQYQPSSDTWRFAENQWDLIVTPEDMTSFYGDDEWQMFYADVTSQYTPTSNSWIDLFGWGTSGYNHGAVCYQPWSTSENSSDYNAYGNSIYNLYDQTGMADWGYNAISNGGNQENLWRTLTKPECEYIFDSRSTVSGIRYAKAKVNGVNGLILLPDDWSSSTYNLNNTNQRQASFSTNIISAVQWLCLEQNGAVFLPAAGYRGDSAIVLMPTAVEGVGSMGCYWLSSRAIDKSFGDHYINSASGPCSRDQGKSVRLVRNVE